MQHPGLKRSWRPALLVGGLFLASPGPALAQPAPEPSGDLEPLELPALAPDTLAFGTTFEIVTGAFSLRSSGQAGNEVDDEVTSLGLSGATRVFSSLEKAAFGYSVEAAGAESLNRAPGDVYSNTLALEALPEARYYVSSPVYLHATADLRLSLTSAWADGSSDSVAPGAASLFAGVGAGRILGVDPVIRVERLEAALASAGALAQPIPAAVGTDLIRTWYALRNDFGGYRTLAHTMSQLAAAEVLQGAPSLRATYQALAVLTDPFLVGRRRGWDARAGLGVAQGFTGYDDAPEPDAALAILASGQIDRPVGTDRQLTGKLKLSYELGGTDEGIARPWSARLFGAFTRVFYNDTYDPLGALTASAEAGVSGLRVIEGADGPEPGLDLDARVAYSRALNRGSLATAGLSMVALNDGTFVLTVDIGLTWGIATGYVTPYAAR